MVWGALKGTDLYWGIKGDEGMIPKYPLQEDGNIQYKCRNCTKGSNVQYVRFQYISVQFTM